MRARHGLMLVLVLAPGCWASFPDPPAGESPGTGSGSPAGGLPADHGSVSGATDPDDGSGTADRPGDTSADKPGSPPAPPPADKTVPAPPPCQDLDKDSYTTCAGDCDDQNAKVRPNQKDFFAAPTTSGSFDYNCDGAAELERPQPLTCSGNCTGKGWVQVPACGVSGIWAECVPGKTDDEGNKSCELKPIDSRQQRCR